MCEILDLLQPDFLQGPTMPSYRPTNSVNSKHRSKITVKYRHALSPAIAYACGLYIDPVCDDTHGEGMLYVQLLLQQLLLT